MIRPSLKFLLATALLALASGAALAASQSNKPGKMYRWVDKNGQVHYGQSIPPEYANQDREVINAQGVTVGREEGALSASEAAAQAEADKAMREAAQQKQRDRVLLQTYQSVDEIAALRDRRLDLIDAQLTIQEQTLATLRQKKAHQEKQAARFAPANKDPKAPPLPDGLAADLARSDSDIKTHTSNLEKKRQERASTVSKFDADIQRFKELKSPQR